MALSNSQYNSIMRIYNQKQLHHKHELDSRTAEVYRKISVIKEINDEIAATALKSARQLLAGDQEVMLKLRKTIADLTEERQALLKSYGYSEDYLRMHYDCEDCKDTGYAGGKKCHCFRQKEIDLLYAQSNIKEALRRENFNTFSYEHFDDSQVDSRSGRTTREYMKQVVSICRQYVDTFSRQKGSLLFTGKTGLGKTFLSNCIAKELIEQSFSVVYLPAAGMFEIFSKEKFDRDSTEEDYDRSKYLMECDLLIIDDLGTELVNAFTASQLFQVVNERLLRKKGTIISTNLPVNELWDSFTDRVMSRLVSQYTVVPLYGDDIRIKIKASSRPQPL